MYKCMFHQSCTSVCFISRVQVYVLSLRQAGGIINTRVVVAAEKGIVEANGCGRLMENGGTMNLGQSWEKSLLIRMNFIRRKAYIEIICAIDYTSFSYFIYTHGCHCPF